jgi:aryl-alcohol dehydrogenase-like predicted oxidoreductase
MVAATSSDYLNLSYFEIERWDAYEITTRPLDPLCGRETIRITLMFRFSRWEVSLYLQSSALDEAAASLKATSMQVALGLLQRSPNILLIPGTSSLEHLHQNIEASMLQIPTGVIADLDAIGGNG